MNVVLKYRNPYLVTATTSNSKIQFDQGGLLNGSFFIYTLNDEFDLIKRRNDNQMQIRVKAIVVCHSKKTEDFLNKY